MASSPFNRRALISVSRVAKRQVEAMRDELKRDGSISDKSWDATMETLKSMEDLMPEDPPTLQRRG